MLRITLGGDELLLFDAHFLIDHPSWQQVDVSFSQHYDSSTKQEEVSDELEFLKIDNFKEDDVTDMQALAKLVDRIAACYMLSLYSDRNETKQKKFLKQVVNGSEWALHAGRDSFHTQPYFYFVDFLFSTIRTIEKQDENKEVRESGILCVEQKRYDRHPSSRKETTSISTAFSKPANTNSNKFHNRCFNFWTSGCSVK